MKIIAVTGGSGFLGRTLIKRLKGKVRVLARNEGLLSLLKQEFPKIEVITGDVADRWSVKKLMQGAEEVYHLAAVKGVDIAERDVMQAVKTNVIGSLNVIEESLITKPKILVAISTDKSSQVSGIYGASKLIMEGLMREAERINPKTKYRVVKYGNVLYSTGSVLCKWRNSMQAGNGVSITDPNMTRFFWTVDEAIDLIFKCISNSKDATPYIPKMKAMRMGDLLKAMMAKYGSVPVNIIGNRGGENLHETMDGKVYSNQVEQFSINEIMKKI